MSYMLTVVMVSLLSGQEISVGMLLLKQIAIGVLCGLVLGKVTVWLLNNLSIELEQGETILVFAVATLAYTLPGLLGGNGYLSVYLCGILMGNSYLPGKRDLVHFFDVVTGVCQMMIFFLLGLLVTPGKAAAGNSAIFADYAVHDTDCTSNIGAWYFASLQSQIGTDWSGVLGRAERSGFHRICYLCSYAGSICSV